MHKTVTFRDRQEHQAADHNNLQTFVRSTFDDLTRDAVTDDRKFSGFVTTQVSTTEIAVAPGRLYDNGRQNINEQSTPFNLLARLPVATKRKVAVVAWGTPVDTNVEARDFLINADTGETEPQAVSMQALRRANLDLVSGVEGADPQLPQVSAETLIVAVVTLGTTGILAIEMMTSNRLENLESLSGRVGGLESWRTQAGTRLETLASDLAGVTNRNPNSAQAALLEQVMFDMARVRDRLELPATYTGYGADMMLTTEKSDTVKVGYAAKVELGLTFPAAASDYGLIALFNQYDANIKVHGDGLVLPAYAHSLRVSVAGYADQRSLTEYQVQAWTLVRNHRTRRRTRYSNSAGKWKGESKLSVLRRTTVGPLGEPPGEQYPVAPLLFRKANNGESATVFQNERKIKYKGSWKYDKNGKYRSDSWSEPYWTLTNTEIAATGAVRAQSFLNAQDGWLSRLGLYFTTLAASGDVRVLVTYLTEAGTPDMESVLAETTLARADMKLYPLETTVDIGPLFLNAGRRYAIVLMSQANHWVALGDKLAYSGGSFFSSSDGSFFSGDEVNDLKFNLYYASFSKTWLQVQLQPLTLSGGIAEIDFIEEGWVPDSTSRVYEVQAPGGVWKSIDPVSDMSLDSLPPLMNFRVTLSGTPDVMPGINLAGTQKALERPAVAFQHFSKQVTLPAATTTIKVKAILDGYVEADHDFSTTLLCGVAGATVETADVTADEVIAGGRIVRTMTFNLAAGQTQFVIRANGATAGATSVFVVDEISYVAL